MAKPDYFLCAVETSEQERKDRTKSYPVRIAAGWQGDKGQVSFSRPKVNLLVTKNTRFVLFENKAGEDAEDEGRPEEEAF